MRNQPQIIMLATPTAIPASLNVVSIERYFDLPPGSLLTKTRYREILMPRQIAIWLDHNEYMEKHKVNGWSIIGRAYNLNHASIIHNVKAVNNDLHNKTFKKMVYDIQLQIYGQIRYPYTPTEPDKERTKIYND